MRNLQNEKLQINAPKKRNAWDKCDMKNICLVSYQNDRTSRKKPLKLATRKNLTNDLFRELELHFKKDSLINQLEKATRFSSV